MNKVILIGNLATDPELRTTTSGISTCSFRLAVRRRMKNKTTGQYESDFINVVAWRQQAELCVKYLAKGHKAGIIGALQSRSYDAQDGTKRYITEVVADEVEFLSGRGSGGSTSASPQSDAPPPDNGSGFDVDDDELPF